MSTPRALSPVSWRRRNGSRGFVQGGARRVAVMQADLRHFSSTETILQIHCVGPLIIHHADPSLDPGKKKYRPARLSTAMDAIVIRFTTSFFDVKKEQPNPINPIPGASLLLWLVDKLRNRVAVPEPQAEDWGWYVDIEWDGRAYMLGASTEPDDEASAPREWILQIVKHRAMKERLFGREKMTSDDPCAAYVRGLLEAEPAFSGVQVD